MKPKFPALLSLIYHNDLMMGGGYYIFLVFKEDVYYKILISFEVTKIPNFERQINKQPKKFLRAKIRKTDRPSNFRN